MKLETITVERTLTNTLNIIDNILEDLFINNFVQWIAAILIQHAFPLKEFYSTL